MAKQVVISILFGDDETAAKFAESIGEKLRDDQDQVGEIVDFSVITL
jgi:hypothetical protein